MKILVTGFNPFGGEKINPAWEAVRRLPTNIGDSVVQTVQIPTEFKTSAAKLIQEMEKFKPDAVICVGQAGGRNAITPERVAINIDDARIPDNASQQPIDVPIQLDGQPAYFSTLPVKAMVEAMKSNGLPAQLSNTAGTFVCNHIMYELLYAIEHQFTGVKGGFIHVPYISEQVADKPNQPSLSLEKIISGLEICLKTLIEFEDKSDLKVVGGSEH